MELTRAQQGLPETAISDEQRALHRVADSAAVPRSIRGGKTGASRADDAEFEWREHPKHHQHFEAAGRDETPPVSGLQQYRLLREQYIRAGYGPNPLATLDDKLVPFPWFGKKVTVDKALRDRLIKAGDWYQKRINASQRPFKREIGGFSPRAQRGSSVISNHALGKAIDVDAETNALIFDKDIIAIINAATQVQINEQLSLEELAEISERFQNFATREWLDGQSGALDASIRKKRKEIELLAQKGFFDLDPVFIVAMVTPDGGGLKWGGEYRHRKDSMHFELV